MYITPLRSESPFPRGHEIYSLIEGFQVYIIQFFFQMSRLRDSLQKIFEKMVKFRPFGLAPKALVEQKSCNLQFMFLLP